MDILTFVVVVSAISFLFLYRNRKVYKYRTMLIDELFKHDNWMERNTYFQSIGYEEMVFKFWKPIWSFYDEDKLLK